uniref:RNA-directed DNA polymerase, eukaryota, reverse transcriptase zinc-binding domain protein n=1 Tax=Tanacetum cinerariifolium TaxID=118510 RepID=A0A6L2N2R4_TANCI|nr:hypothetical protein [Tanacetum cinerariifolium]
MVLFSFYSSVLHFIMIFIFEIRKENTPINNHDPTLFPSLKKADSVLKPKKTTRMMNPESGDTMKHRTMLGRSSQVSFKERVTRSSSKKGDSVMDMDEDGCNKGILESGGVKDGVSVGDEAELIFGSICKDPKVSTNANVSSEPGMSVNSDNVNANVSDKPGVNVNYASVMPEMPVPFDENPILNPNAKGSQSTSGSVSNFEVGGQGNNVGSDFSKSGSLKQSVSFASAVAKSFGGFGNNNLKYVTMALNDKGREVAVMDPVLEVGIDKWSMTVVGHFVRFQMGYREIIENGPWMVENKPLFVQAWNVEGISRIASCIGVPIIMDKITISICEKPYGRAPYARVLVEVDAAKGLVDSVEIWYKSLGKSMILNVEYVWRPSLCDHCKTFGHFSKNVNSDQDGWQNVDYKRGNRKSGNNSQQHSFNGHIGRGYMGYKGREGYNNRGRNSGVVNGVKVSSAKYVPVKSSEISMTVDECVVADEVVKEISNADIGSYANKGSSNNALGEMEMSGKVNGFSVKESALVEEVSIRNIFDVLNKDDVDSNSNNWKALYEKKWQERPYADKSPSEIKVIKLMKSLRYKIGQANMSLNVNARTAALKLVKENDEATCIKSSSDLCNKCYEQYYREELLKVKELQWVRRKAESDLFILSRRLLVDDIKDIWTDDMMKYYSDRCDEIKNDEKNGHYADDGGLFYTDEVDEETSGSAGFVTQNEVFNGISNATKQDDVKLLFVEEKISMCAVIETQVSKKFVNRVGDYVFGNWAWVSNSVDSNRGCRIMVGWDRSILEANLISLSDQVMHFEVNFVHDHRKQFVSFVYATYTERDRKPLWRNLIDHYCLVNNEPWVVLGDFNVTMNVEECSNSFNVIDKDIDDFRRVLYSLDLEDITSYGVFYTWIQKRRNPEPGILKKLDIISGNTSFLSSYGSCFAKFLPYMTSDHSSSILVYPDIKAIKPREEEYIYCNAYKEAISDEEKGRMYRIRIKVVYDAQGKKYEGDDIASKFFEHFQNFLGFEDEVIPIDNLDGHYPNMSKSTIFYGNVPYSVKDEIQLVMPFREGALPVRYLGILLTAKKLSIGDCRVLVEKAKGSGWHSNSPLCRLISDDVVKSSGFDLKAKVADFVANNGWKWPSRWNGRFNDVLYVPVPVLDQDRDDMALWFNKHNEKV